jgi:hypothetical protein
MSFAEHTTRFLFNLKFDLPLPDAISVMNPFDDADTKKIVSEFYNRFYGDDRHRWMIIGINPGRFGGGITGIPFTDPVRLQQKCNIENPWKKKQELSSVFIYQMIDAYGGVQRFYKNFYITAVSPLGFTKHDKNLNYYDDTSLLKDIRPFAVDCIRKQLAFGIHRNAVFCLGDGKNFKFISALNKEHRFFKHVIPLSHPRFIMQYRLKTKEIYLARYLAAFDKWCKPSAEPLD